MPYDARYLRGIEEFNRQKFFESHEVWEDLWRDEHGPARLFYKGLIQVAVALHHLRNGNLRGAKNLWGRSRHYLEPYMPKYLGLDVAALLIAASNLIDGPSPSAGASPSSRFPHLQLEPQA